MTTQSYGDFLAAKVRIAERTGFDVALDEINPALKDHTRAIVRWMVAGGRRACFARFGLHKTATQIEALRLLGTRVAGKRLIVLPLGVRAEFFKEAARRFHGAFAVRLKFVRTPNELEGDEIIYLTNYETVRDGKLDPSLFVAVSLDEAACLRSYGSKTFQTFLPLFRTVRYRFVATATPSPNRLKELIHYAGFLDVMDTGEALTRWFQRNSEKANDLTLYPHKEREFWLWVNTWAVFLQKPSDLGFSDEGYEMPPLDVRWHEVKTRLLDGSFDRDGQGVLIRDEGSNIVAAAREKRESLDARVTAVKAIVEADPEDHFILWHDLEDERRALEKALPAMASVFGAQKLEVQEEIVARFADGDLQHLGGKPVMLGSGGNLQAHCHRAVFVGITAKFNDFIQAIHRLQRFGQPHPVRIDIVHTDQERATVRILREKWTAHEETAETMSAILRQYGLEQLNMADEMRRAIGVTRVEASGEGWHVANNDCVDETAGMADGSVDLIVTSIPFSNHYEYTPSYNDFGHTDDNAHFWAQMDFLTKELFRVLAPGRFCCLHVKDRINFGNVTGEGVPTVSPFHAETITHGIKHGFQYMGLITIVTDVVFENNGTYRLSYGEMLKDGTKMGVGSPEYVVLLRKPQSDKSKGYADDPVRKTAEEYSLARWQLDAHAFWRDGGDRLLTIDELAALPQKVLVKAFTERSMRAVYDFREHVEIGEALAARDHLSKTFMSIAHGSPSAEVWTDIVRMRTLNAEQAAKGREKHICPLQLQVVDRLIERYSMRGETVFDPFGGLFTVPFCAIGLGRVGRAVELNEGYFRDGVRHLQAKERELAVPTLLQLFDAARDEGPSAPPLSSSKNSSLAGAPAPARDRIPVPRKSAPDPGVSAPALGELKALLDRMSPEELRQSWYGWDDGCLYAGDDLVIDPEGRAAA